MKRVERIKDAHRYAYPHLAHSNMQNEFTIMLLFTNEIVNWTLWIVGYEKWRRRRRRRGSTNTDIILHLKRERERREANRGGVAWRWWRPTFSSAPLEELARWRIIISIMIESREETTTLRHPLLWIYSFWTIGDVRFLKMYTLFCRTSRVKSERHRYRVVAREPKSLTIGRLNAYSLSEMEELPFVRSFIKSSSRWKRKRLKACVNI